MPPPVHAAEFPVISDPRTLLDRTSALEGFSRSPPLSPVVNHHHLGYAPPLLCSPGHCARTNHSVTLPSLSPLRPLPTSARISPSPNPRPPLPPIAYASSYPLLSPSYDPPDSPNTDRMQIFVKTLTGKSASSPLPLPLSQLTPRTSHHPRGRVLGHHRQRQGQVR